MNSFAMNLNNLTDELKAKLPPTDCRLRPDLRLLEEKSVDDAEAEKDRLEANQRKRKEARLARAEE